MSDSLDLTIVVPCLNEESNVQNSLEELATAMQQLPYRYEVLVIDDGSTDGTSRVVEAYAAAHPDFPLQLRKNPTNRGLTRTYVDGAFLGRGEYYRLVCGDNVESAETIVAALRHLGEADMVLTYWVELPGKPFHRRFLSNFYTMLVNVFSGYKFHYYNGPALHRRYNVMRWGPYSFGFGFQADLITRLVDEGATFIELGVAGRHIQKASGNSALNLRNFLSVAHTLLEIVIRRIRRQAFERRKA